MGKNEERFNNRRLQMAYFTSVVSISMVLFVLGTIGMLLFSAGKLTTYVKENLKLQIGLTVDMDESKSKVMLNQVKSKEFIREARLITPDQALAEFKKTWNEDPTEILGFNPLGYTIEISLKEKYTDLNKIKETEAILIEEFGEQIRGISKDENMIRDIQHNTTRIQYVLLGICIFLSIIMAGLINNTIRLAVYSKRFTIKTMQLVGATADFIRKPFLYNGILQGLIAGVVSSVGLLIFILYITRQYGLPLLNNDLMIISLIFISIPLIGVIISFISTFLAVRKFLRLKVDELY
jgi:cell division transport system permease protein